MFVSRPTEPCVLTVWVEMGVDQSTLSSTPLKSQRDEDIPYTSCSISKPIGSGDVSEIRILLWMHLTLRRQGIAGQLKLCGTGNEYRPKCDDALQLWS